MSDDKKPSGGGGPGRRPGGGGGFRGRGDRDRDKDGGDDSKGPKIFGASHARRKVCRFCTDQDFHLDYKNARVIQSFMSEHGKIVPRRISGNCAAHQRRLTVEVKRARNLALVGYTSFGPN